MIPYGRQSIDEQDVESVISVLKSDYLTQGPQVPQFEAAVAAYCGVAHTVAVNSATSALHMACLALGAGPGDIVWTSPNTFVASANCARYCGASVDFVDIDPVTFNMCPDALAEKLERAEKNGALPKIVIPVHFAGLPCDMARIQSLANQYGFSVIEDASHAIGARYKETVVGDCKYSDVTVFSFHPVKIITTAEGGLATTKSASLARKMQLLRAHGITRENEELENKDEGPWYYEQKRLGFNYRMTELQAALGISQIRTLDARISRRFEIARWYEKEISGLPVILPKRAAGRVSALHLFPIQIDETRTEITRRQAFEHLRAAQIGVNVHYIPVYWQPYFRDIGFKKGTCPIAETYYERTISMPLFPALTSDDLRYVRNALTQLFS